ncbi:amidohydrolase family protein [Alloscardovia macacae]|uniref:Amidohydrolase n=1 Tax=Alloscardovia macacae TaxID=1160091 RepID=A0A261F5I8_9BIFI|nr:amidohydrolase family protein [Alloscardovia macacae]OZG54335.1 amidohydrolase [Alloscardovia macacae]
MMGALTKAHDEQGSELTPVQKVLDSHVHLWNWQKQNLPWVTRDMKVLQRTYTLDDLVCAYDSARTVPQVQLVSGVYVEVDTPDWADEDIRAAQLQESAGFAMCLQARLSTHMRVPLCARAVREVLHTTSAREGRCLEREFLDGLRLLADRHIAFDACVRTEELDDLVRACERIPQATVVLDHVGNVTNSAQLESALPAFERLATLENVYVKVSGYPTADVVFADSICACMKSIFSPERLLYASNWPVIQLYGGLAEHLQIVMKYWNGDDNFFYANARRVYGGDDEHVSL